MRVITANELQTFSAEQIAGLLLKIFQDMDSGIKHPTYNPESLESMLSFDINPIWLGKDVRNGVIINHGSVSTYGGETVPDRLNTL